MKKHRICGAFYIRAYAMNSNCHLRLSVIVPSRGMYSTTRK